MAFFLMKSPGGNSARAPRRPRLYGSRVAVSTNWANWKKTASGSSRGWMKVADGRRHNRAGPSPDVVAQGQAAGWCFGATCVSAGAPMACPGITKQFLALHGRTSLQERIALSWFHFLLQRRSCNVRQTQSVTTQAIQGHRLHLLTIRSGRYVTNLLQPAFGSQLVMLHPVI